MWVFRALVAMESLCDAHPLIDLSSFCCTAGKRGAVLLFDSTSHHSVGPVDSGGASLNHNGPC